MLSCGGNAETKSSSVDVSIKVSLESDRLLNDSESIKLLQLLSILPADIEDLQKMSPKDLNTFQASSTLLQTAACFQRQLRPP